MKRLASIILVLALLCGVWAAAHAVTYTFTVVDPSEEDLNRILALLQEIQKGGDDDGDEGVSIRGKTLKLNSARYAKGRGIELKWDDLGPGVTYTVYRRYAKAEKFSRIASAGDSTTYLDEYPSRKGYVYYYYIKATDQEGHTVVSNIRGSKVNK